ncbi:MAG: DUF4214 domain-containing protein [Rhodobacteraceae bacterium]|nr:DUF4214 domain-containing protein [Paracoccaceae bacterium]
MTTIFGTLGDDVIQAPTAAGLVVTLAGDDVITLPPGFDGFSGQTTDYVRVDGGTGADRVEVVFPGTNSLDLVGDLVLEVDPILYPGYTHRIIHTQVNTLNSIFVVESMSLVRDVETVTRLDGTVVTLTTGALPWHAETRVVQYDTELEFRSNLNDWQTVASLTGGNVARVLTLRDGDLPGADNTKNVVQILNGDGAVVFTSAPFGADYVQSSPRLIVTQNSDPMIAALPDGGFAVAWMEQLHASSSQAGPGAAIRIQMFEADGSMRGDEQTVAVGDRLSRGDMNLSAIANDRLVLTRDNSSGTEVITHILDSDGATLATNVFDGSGFLSHDTAIAYGDGYALLYQTAGQTDQFGRNFVDLALRLYTVDEATGAVSANGQATLIDMNPDERINYAAYANLGPDALAAVVATTEGRLLLSTYVDGAVNTRPVEMPYARQSSNDQVSLVSAPGGGAWLSFEANTITDREGVAFGTDAFAGFIDANGVQGPMASVTDRVDNLVGNNYDPVTAATDDGIIVLWQAQANLYGISYQAADGYNTIIGGAGDETLAGTAADDHILAGDGDDRLEQNAGVDRFDGQGGRDTFVMDPGTGGFASLEQGRTGALDGTGPVEALIGIENLVGSDAADSLEDDAGANDIQAGGGDDTILGHGGDDTLNGGAGEDLYRPTEGLFQQINLPASAAIERLDLVNGDLDGTDGADTFDLSGITSYEVFDIIDMGNGNDAFTGTQADDSVQGDAGDDRLDGQAGNDTITGSSGSDTLIGGTGDDRLSGGTSFSTGNTFVFAPGDGNDVITDYQQSRDSIDLSGFTLDQLAQMQVTLDGDGNRFITFHDGGTLTLEGVGRNHTPIGSVGVSGERIEDAVLTADISTLTDYDTFRPEDVTYQWLRDGDPVSGATGTSYTLGQADVGARVTVQARYTDLFRTEETVESSPGQVVRNINDLPVGEVILSGDAVQGAVLSADASGLSDSDGISGAFSYQWKRGDAAIAGATDATYTTTQQDVGQRISVTVAYTDDQSTREEVDSARTEPVVDVNDEPEGTVSVSGTAREDDTLRVLTDLRDVDGIGAFSYEWLRGGTPIPGATEATYQLRQPDVNAQISVRVSYTDAAGTLETVTSLPTQAVSNRDDPLTGTVRITGPAVEGSTVTARPDLTDEDGITETTYQWQRNGVQISGATDQTYTLNLADAGAAISVLVQTTDAFGGTGAVFSETLSGIAARPELRATPDANNVFLAMGTPEAERLIAAPSPDSQNVRNVLVGNGGNDLLIGSDLAESSDELSGDLRGLFRYEGLPGAQLYRLYRATLDRDPDAVGFAGWMDYGSQFRNLPLPEITTAFITSQEFLKTYGTLDDRSFIETLYQNVLGRSADETGLNGWLEQLANGGSREGVVLGLSLSPEFEAQTTASFDVFIQQSASSYWTDDVFRLYKATLDREPDVAGLTGWATQLAGGTEFLSVVGGFTASDEFGLTYGALDDTAFVSLLYNNVLGRSPADAEVASWLALMDGGLSRVEVVRGFSQSPEFIAATNADVAAWVRAQGTDDVLDGGGGDNILRGGILSDQFVFDQADGGSHQVEDLETWDTLAFNGFGYADADAVLALFSQGPQLFEGQDAYVSFEDQGTRIQFQNTVLADITADMIVI